MICQFCGKQVDDNAAICRFCGSSLKSKSAVSSKGYDTGRAAVSSDSDMTIAMPSIKDKNTSVPKGFEGSRAVRDTENFRRSTAGNLNRSQQNNNTQSIPKRMPNNQKRQYYRYNPDAKQPQRKSVRNNRVSDRNTASQYSDYGNQKWKAKKHGLLKWVIKAALLALIGIIIGILIYIGTTSATNWFKSLGGKSDSPSVSAPASENKTDSKNNDSSTKKNESKDPTDDVKNKKSNSVDSSSDKNSTSNSNDSEKKNNSGESSSSEKENRNKDEEKVNNSSEVSENSSNSSSENSNKDNSSSETSESERDSDDGSGESDSDSQSSSDDELED